MLLYSLLQIHQQKILQLIQTMLQIHQQKILQLIQTIDTINFGGAFAPPFFQKEVIILNVIFYHSSSDKRKVDKSLTNITTLSCEILDDNSILHPQLKLKYNASLMTANYIFIPAFNRYYFITNTTTSRGYLYINTSVDVLMTYKLTIRNTTAVIDRQENVYNKYLNDPLYEGYSYEILSAYKMGNIFTKASQPYLTVLGGV